MVHPFTNVVLLTSLLLRGLVVVPGLLLLLLLLSLPLSTFVGLAWSVLDILRASVSKMFMITTLEANIPSNGRRVVVPHRCAGGSVLAVLWETGPCTD